MTIDSRTTFEVWQFLIYDEALSRAVFDGSYKELAHTRGYSSEQVAVLDWFASQPGMRWNVENLRFRAALETAACIAIHMPHTARLISANNDDWLQDICYEYLAFYSWDALGHRRLTECERFGTYTRERIMRRRIMPAHFEHVLELELAIVGVHKKTAEVKVWPERVVLDDEALLASRPRRSIPQTLLEQQVDLRPFLAETKALEVKPAPGPVTWFIHVPSATQAHKMKVIGDGVRDLITACDGEHTASAIADAIQQKLSVERYAVVRILRTCIDQGAIIVG